MLDTLQAAKALIKSGFSENQAESIIDVVNHNSLKNDKNLATKNDIRALDGKIELLDNKIENTKIALKKDIEMLDSKLDNKIEITKKDLTIRIGGMIALAVVVITFLDKVI